MLKVAPGDIGGRQVARLADGGRRKSAAEPPQPAVEARGPRQGVSRRGQREGEKRATPLGEPPSNGDEWFGYRLTRNHTAMHFGVSDDREHFLFVQFG